MYSKFLAKFSFKPFKCSSEVNKENCVHKLGEFSLHMKENIFETAEYKMYYLFSG